MSDARLRQLQRRYRHSGQAEDEVVYLRAWARGDVQAAARVACAAALGDARAQGLGLEPPAGDPWLAGLELLDAAALRRLACDLAEQVLPRWLAHRPGDDAPAAAIAASRAFAAGTVSAAALRAAWTQARIAWRDAEGALGAEAPAARAARSACCVARGGPADAALTHEAAEHAARTARLPLAPGNPVHEWQRARLADALLERGAAAREDEAACPTYSPAFTFAVGDRLRHPRFGEGVVQRAGARQIEVAFGGGDVRTLAQGR